MRRHQKSTIKEVAQRACVSPSIVSYVVSGREDKCSAETVARIREAITHFRYTPNSLSRSLRTGSTRTIGISVTRSSRVNSYGVRLWSGFDYATDAAKYSQIYYPDDVRYGPSVDSYLDGRIDGLILAPSNPDDRPKQIAAANMPIVILDPSDDVPDGCGVVYVNEQQVVDLVMSHLWESGHRGIVHIVGPVVSTDVNPYAGKPSKSAIARRDGYVKWMSERGVYNPDYLVPALTWGPEESSLSVIRSYFQRWLSHPDPPTAAFCVNDAVALAVMDVARSMGLSVPNDFSVVGVDNDGSCLLLEPSLTSVDIPAEEVGREAVNALFRVMHGAPADECRTIVPVTKLMVRGSTKQI